MVKMCQIYFFKLYSIMIDNNVSVLIVDDNVMLWLDHNFWNLAGTLLMLQNKKFR